MFFVFLHMVKIKLSLLFIAFVSVLHAQNEGLPVDLRQHNLTDSNSSILNPAFSSNYGNTHSVGLWSRWQWQTVDGDPTTFFLNYTGKINNSSSIGAGFYQHNTDVYLNTGGVLNYAYRYDFNDRASLTFGLNFFAYQQEFSGNPFQGDPQILLPFFTPSEDFILQFAPGVQFAYDGLRIGFSSENMFDYNMAEKEGNTASDEKIFLGTVSYDIPVSLGASDSTSVIRPMLYIKSIPTYDTQVGLSAVLSTNKFWAQAGYNSFYGIAIGGGGRIMKRFSIGALVEFGTDSDLKGNDPTVEFTTAYDFGRAVTRKKADRIDREEEPKEEELEQIADVDELSKELTKAEALALKREARQKDISERKRKRDSVIREKKANDDLAVQMRKDQKQRLDSIAKAEKNKALVDTQKLRMQQQMDSINTAKIAAENAAKEEQLQAELIKQAELVKQTEEEKPKAGEKYEEVVGEDGLKPGYYLIANVFGTKRYLDAFKADLTKKGLQPKSFLRSKNKLNYVYLGRFDSMSEARKARDSKFDGRYTEKTWIYRVVPK
ncbi:type IX secretion system PorP/SprF family membrane protein [Maribacter polysiphoniae]|uniref:Type IX secretion system PorP/SprF family membrane protein n=1 Tax=Maribacter polysiphoniae TaxID=429344 RepID=A0A316E0J1_9FLAO|nr:type IX secretion system PorP/SprF family membrane protein [Maribacter polysiphoniae]